MTDIIDYQVDNLKPSVFEHSNRPLPSTAKEENYLDLISLISLLTQSNEINYQLIADFFLTYRSFISQKSLLKVLLLRIKWCFDSISDISHELKQNHGKLSLIRTFVMIRHWLLNYFTDDFIPFPELRKLFVTCVNELEHHEIFVQRIIGNLKQVWTQCCNKSWDEDIKPTDFYSYQIRIGPQGNKSNRLSAFALNQQNDPFTRNSVMLSTFDKNAIHRLPIPIHQSVNSVKGTKHEPKVMLNPKNSSYRLSQVVLNQIRTSSDLSPNRNPLYIPLNSSIDPRSKNTIRDSTEFPKTPTLSTILPPTPVKKMDINVPQPPVTKPQTERGLKALIESWLRTFHLHNASVKNSKHPENFIKTVVSVAEIDNSALNYLAEGKFDILSARTIDELEYLVRFHNELINKYGTKLCQPPANDSFSFTIDEPYENILKDAPFGKGASNIDNMNICETISNISKSVTSLQHLNEPGSHRSYISYDSLYSRHNKSLNNLAEMKSDSGLRKKTRVSNLREFNFEKEVASEPVDNLSLRSFPSSIISESTSNQIVSESDDDQGAEVATYTNETHGHDSQDTVLLEPSDNSVQESVSDIARPVDQSGPEAAKNIKVESPETKLIDLEQSKKGSALTLETELHNSWEYLERKKSAVPSVGDKECNEFKSFASSYEGPEERIQQSDSELNADDQASSVFNEPSTPPAIASNDGLISTEVHVSPIKPITEDHVFHKPSLSYHNSQEHHFNGQVEEQLDLNRVPTFNRISSGSIATRQSQARPRQLDRQMSYLSQRSNRASGVSINSSVFSGMDSNTKIVNIAVEPRASEKDTQEIEVSSTVSKHSEKARSSKSVSLVDSIDSNDYNIPYPGVNSEVIAELAGITDGSIQDDPISAALLKLEGNYKSCASRDNEEQSGNSFDSKELNRQVNSLVIQSPISRSQKQLNRNSVFVDQRRKTRMFSLTPVKKKDVIQEISSSKLLLELLLSRKLDNDVLKVSNCEQHISFILNYDSKTIAEQFTMIERDALLEIDWKELVQLKWDSTNLIPINSWLELLIQNEDIHGVDLCISRFNLTVNWIISEILLTKDITLRKLTIQRFIHVAQNCKEIQNYSTLMQILLALGSDKVLKLKETWRIVEPGDILTYKNLESIASPLKNFLTLRSHLNKLKPSLGCVPFLGLYLSDLLFNKEKKNSLDDKINFGKFKQDSKIVRSLIQCIQWSTLYKIKVNDEVLSKCLYIKSLSEEEMIECTETLK